MRKLRLRHLLIAGVALLAMTGCTPEEITAFNAITAPYRDVLSDDQLARLRGCESHGNYGAVSRNGRYRGAYQFSQATWDRVARDHFPHLQGQDPAGVEPWWQDSMAKALWSESGPRSWPHCGQRV